MPTRNPYGPRARYRHRRVRAPGQFVRGSLRLTKKRKGVRVVVGVRRGKPRRVTRGPRKGKRALAVQAVLTPKRQRNAPVPQSEREAYRYIGGRLLYIMRHSSGGVHDQAQAAAKMVAELAGQLARGVHVNPPVAIFGANPRGAPCLSEQVQAVLYRHAEDGRDYVHPFGRGVTVKNKRDGSTVVRAATSARSGVRATLLQNGSVLLWHPSKRLWGDFKV